MTVVILDHLVGRSLPYLTVPVVARYNTHCHEPQVAQVKSYELPREMLVTLRTQGE